LCTAGPLPLLITLRGVPRAVQLDHGNLLELVPHNIQSPAAHQQAISGGQGSAAEINLYRPATLWVDPE
jgi:hypothetical protein